MIILKQLRKKLLTKSFCTKKLDIPKKYSETVSKARTVMPLYHLVPYMEGDIFVAPNASIIGEVFIGNKVSIWHGTVIRADINQIM